MQHAASKLLRPEEAAVAAPLHRSPCAGQSSSPSTSDLLELPAALLHTPAHKYIQNTVQFEAIRLSIVQSVLNKTAHYGFLPEWTPKTIDELLESSDITLSKAALKNPDHVIHPLLPPPKAPSYNLRKRSHGLLLPTTQFNLLRKNFVYCMLFKDI